MRPHRHSVRVSFVLILVAILAGCEGYTETAWTPDPTEPRAFVSTLGTDTTTVEVYTRTENRIEGVLVERSPNTHVIRYTADIDDEGHILRIDGVVSTPEENPDGPETVSWAIAVENGEATIIREGGDNPGTVTMPVSDGVIPFLGRANTAMFVFEQVATQLLASETPDPVHLIGPTSTRPSQNNAIVISSDSISMDFFGSPRLGWLDGEGQLLGVSGAQTTMKAESRRVAYLDIENLASRWAEMDARGEGMGVPSISGTVSASVDGANFEVRYSRPAKRGREIWGGLVPNGEVWRTGANAATHFTTDSDLTIGGVDLPSGTYTLFSIYSDGEVQLIINSQTGQWGVPYDGTQEFARIPMTAETLPEISERFTIRIEDTDDGGTLYLDWDMTSYKVEFQVR